MRWRGRRSSSNVDDRRGAGPTRRVSGIPRGRGAPIGGGLALLLVVGFLLAGGDPATLLALLGDGASGTAAPYDEPASTSTSPPGDDELARFVAVILADTEDTWQARFAELGRRYEPPTLVLFSDEVSSGCGFQSAAVGPFYCPPDQQVYIDLGFYHELERRFGAPGDFAQAYVLAHEVGHHVQKLLGISDRVQAERARRSVPLTRRCRSSRPPRSSRSASSRRSCSASSSRRARA